VNGPGEGAIAPIAAKARRAERAKWPSHLLAFAEPDAPRQDSLWYEFFVPGAPEELPDWEQLLAAERHLQQLLPGAVLVGGTAAALHAHHRRSFDGDHVLLNLRERFDDVLAELEAAAGWQTSRVKKPVLILRTLDGMLTGIRQLRRTRPLETEVIENLTVPTLPEMARVKAWLLATRNTVRDYLDLVVLLDRLDGTGPRRLLDAFAEMDELYVQPTGASVLAEVIERLGDGAPVDLGDVELQTYRGLTPPWNDWSHVNALGRVYSSRLAEVLLDAK
jgi:hypothetical protein